MRTHYHLMWAETDADCESEGFRLRAATRSAIGRFPGQNSVVVLMTIAGLDHYHREHGENHAD